jgi:rare lipoprotein A
MRQRCILSPCLLTNGAFRTPLRQIFRDFGSSSHTFLSEEGGLMFARTFRVFPGAIVSLLLFAAPAYADLAITAKERAIHAPRRGSGQARSGRSIREAHARSLRYRTEPVGPAAEGDATGVEGTSTPLDRAAVESGMASWYGRFHQGRITSSGQRFDQNQLTAAHRWLPLGSRVRVRLVGTDRTVDVIINDRPGTRRRIIDLSREAARQLGMIRRGTALVSLSRL